MSFLKFLFKNKPVKKLLGGGLIYSDGKENYYIDSNNDIGIKKKNVKIFRDDIRKIVNNDFKIINEDTLLTETEKRYIALKVKKELEAEGVNVEITPSLPIDFLLANK